MAIIDTESVAILQKLSRHTSDVTSCDFSNNLHLCSGSGDKKVVLYEWKQGLGFVEANFSPLTGHKYSVTATRFSPNAPILATGSVDGHTILWNLKNGESIQSLVQANGNGVRCLAFSRDGTLLASAGEGGVLCIWSITIHNNSLIRSINGHDEESIQGISFSPDGLILVSGDVTGSLKVWSMPAIRDDMDICPLMTVRDVHDLGINNLEFSPEHTAHQGPDEGLTEREYLLATCGNDHTIALWQINTIQSGKDTAQVTPSPNPDLVARFTGHNSAVSQIRISPKGDLIASTSIDKTTRIWQISTGRCIITLEGHSRYVTSCAFSPDQSLLVTGSNDKTIIVWDLTGTVNVDSSLFNTMPLTVSLSQSTSMSNRMNDHKGIQLVHKLDKHLSSVNSVHVSSQYLVSGGSDHRILIWSWDGLKSMTLLHCLEEAHRYPVHQVEICPNTGVLASCSLDGTAILWNPETGQVKKSGFHVSGSGVRCVRISPDSNLLAAGGDDDLVKVYRMDTYQLIESLPGDGEGAVGIAFTPDSHYIMVGSQDGHCRLYPLSPVSPVPSYILENSHDLGVTAMDFSETVHAQIPKEEGRYELATCGQDYNVKVWNVKAEEGKCSINIVWTLSGHGGGVTCVRYSPKLAEMIASTSTDKTCRLWDSYSGDCLHIVEHSDGILTCCAFSPDATFLATGSMNKCVLIWELPKDLAFRSFVANRQALNIVESWTVDNVNSWLEAFNLPPCNITGKLLLSSPLEEILNQLNIEDESRRAEMAVRLEELRKDYTGTEPPHEFLCPITHQLMRDPVKAADGHTYERMAIESWFSTGHSTSPMTNDFMVTNSLEPNLSLREAITMFLT